MAKVKVLRDFRDRENDLQLRKAGTVFEVGHERAKLLQGKRLVQIEPETQPDPEKKPKKKR